MVVDKRSDGRQPSSLLFFLFKDATLLLVSFRDYLQHLEGSFFRKKVDIDLLLDVKITRGKFRCVRSNGVGMHSEETFFFTLIDRYVDEKNQRICR